MVAQPVQRHAGALFLPALGERQQQLEKEELLELEPPDGPPTLGGVAWEVDRPQRHVAVFEPVPLADRRGQHLGDGEPVLLDEPVDQPPERPVDEPDFFERRRAPVDRDDAARGERRPLVAQGVGLGVGHRKLAPVLFRLAVEGVKVAPVVKALDVVRAPEPDTLERAAVLVGHADLEAARAAPRHQPLRGHRPDDRDRPHALRDLADGRDGGPVEVGARVVAQQVVPGPDADLAERLGAALADAGELLDVGVEDVGVELGLGHASARGFGGGQARAAGAPAVCLGPRARA